MMNAWETCEETNVMEDIVHVALPGIPFDIILDNDFLLGNKSMNGIKHTHPVFDVHFAAKGSFRINFNHNEKIVQENELIVVNPNVYHGLPCTHRKYLPYRFSRHTYQVDI